MAWVGGVGHCAAHTQLFNHHIRLMALNDALDRWGFVAGHDDEPVTVCSNVFVLGFTEFHAIDAAERSGARLTRGSYGCGVAPTRCTICCT